MIPSERRDFIYRYVYEHQTVSINDLVGLMNVSHMTVRRDIRMLEEEGKVVGISGGVRLNDALRQELPWSEKARLHHQTKREIGQFASSLVEDGQVVYLDAGTTTFEIARVLGERFNLTIVTNDFSIMQYLMNKSQLNLYHTGGQVDKRNHSCVGNTAAAMLQTLNVDIAFISTSSWDLQHGVSTPHEEKVQIKQTLLDVARRCVLVSDSSKFGKYGMFRVCPLDQLHDIICDQHLPSDVVQRILEKNIKLHLINT
ncbi:DeoR/GlpR family DNA-binding transcription regulator [Providencia sp. PROV188]|jgi:DeoR/GlpR family transcriptional regulator of sugar metabolism|uniref:DeoR/GlpR family DNA-binding transcription regulator n=1 Tax=Providencia zhijiangensis TaxID=3053982 RepID=A0ABZ0N2N3_9GAMM|nr:MULTISPECIES: DeoR/GlpR family DNA-binding transcription regulator [Providencia]MTC74932.1 DeoR family transcriptional regulator [Providencia sp. wls1919]ETS99023.1 transcriptional regulator, DeoR family [Providencia alcalifaciens PAL-3]EUC99348.1 transcriptional regulator, DeoR family [Providencia alcalifaciens PAL-1]MBS0923630.1 DeoR/GlpR transcriptional regulator [Providencia sp. JGM181]MBS0934959.1 DeoR/GlpR transcriptional regulator [Providencia sp. JGM172]